MPTSSTAEHVRIHANSVSTHPDEEFILVLQGGGALGAYQAGLLA
jgi:predicted acylesterase/phospholipase RssA